jgi:tetratricopeptide (TPR) repeat protein
MERPDRLERNRYSWLIVLLVCAAARPVRADKQQAQETYKRASQHYDLGEYQQALEGFKDSYRNFEDPSLLYNIAQCHRQLGNKADAIRAYRTYLIKMPDPPNRDAVKAMIEKLETALGDEQAIKQSPPQGAMHPTAPPPPKAPTAEMASTEPALTATISSDRGPRSRAKIVTGIVLGAVGVGAVVGGVASGVLAQQAGNDLTRLDQGHMTFDPARESAGRSEQIAEGVLLGIGGAAALTGALLVALGRREARARRLAVHPTGGAGRAGLVLSGVFQ